MVDLGKLKQVVLYVSLDATFRFFKICNKSENEGKLILSHSFSLGSCVCVSILERQAPLGTMPPPSDIVKVAIEWPGANAQLLEIDQVSSGSEESGSAGPEASFRVGTTGISSRSQSGPAPCSGRLVTTAGKRLPLQEKLSEKKSVFRRQADPAWQTLSSGPWQ